MEFSFSLAGSINVQALILYSTVKSLLCVVCVASFTEPGIARQWQAATYPRALFGACAAALADLWAKHWSSGLR